MVSLKLDIGLDYGYDYFSQSHCLKELRAYCQVNPDEDIVVELVSKFKHFHSKKNNFEKGISKYSDNIFQGSNHKQSIIQINVFFILFLFFF